MGALGCCPMRYDTVAMFDARDVPEMGSPTGFGLDVERDAAFEEAQRGAGEREREQAVVCEVESRVLSQSLNDSLRVLKRRRRLERVTRSVQLVQAPAAMTRVRAEKPKQKIKSNTKAVFETSDDLSPLDAPEKEIERFISASNHVTRSSSEVAWEEQLAGVATANRLVMHHQTALALHLRPFIIAVASCVECMRSSVSKAALNLVTTMAHYIGDRLSAEFGCLLPCLLKRSSESNFLSADADLAMQNVISVIHPHVVIRELHHFANDRRLRARVLSALEFCVTMCAEEDVFRGRAGRAACEHALAILDETMRCADAEMRQCVKIVLRRVYDITTPNEWTRAMRIHPDLNELFIDLIARRKCY